MADAYENFTKIIGMVSRSNLMESPLGEPLATVDAIRWMISTVNFNTNIVACLIASLENNSTETVAKLRAANEAIREQNRIVDELVEPLRQHIADFGWGDDE